MSKRYYYTDPLAAAWMHAHHGLDFDAEGRSGIHVVWGIELPVRPGPKYYIHPDSLHLLEPQVGDIVAIRVTAEFDEKNQTFIERTYCNEAEPDTLAIVQKTLSKGGYILQRNGIAFMCPEAEDCAKSAQNEGSEK